MNPLPDIVVLDFCEWLNKKLMNSGGKRPSILDIIMSNGNNRYLLEEYARKYLESRRETDCSFKNLMLLFFNSEEYHRAIQDCCGRNAQTREHCKRSYDIYDCFYCPEMRHAIHRFTEEHARNIQSYAYKNISATHLANCTRYAVLYESNNTNIGNQPPLLELMMNSAAELSEELSFFGWLECNMDSATDVRKMPTAVFEKFVDKYINDNNKSDNDRKHLLKSYHRTGWESLLEQFQVLLRMKERKSKNVSEVMARYYSHYGKYKCIILPLSDPKSQQIYRSLINDSWEDLNSCSGNTLDIYYSDADTGKSGFDIAKRINSLPKSLTCKAPCLIVWEHSMQDAEAISISQLDSLELVELIRSLVENMQSNMKLNKIMEEARKKVEKLQNDKKQVSNYYITGDGNVVGKNNDVVNVKGSSNTITNTSQADYTENLSNKIEEFEKAIRSIQDSKELVKAEDIKAQLIEIMKTAKDGVFEQSTEKQEKAKTEFGYIKCFLTKLAPKLVETLANILTIATFFGIVF